MSRQSIAERHATISVILKYDLMRHERLREAVEADLVARAGENGAGKLKRTLWDILFIILEDYLTGRTTLISNLHVETGRAKPTVNSRLNELIAMGVVHVRTDDTDRRRRILTLSGAFMKVVDQFVEECSSEFKDLIDIHDRRERIDAEKSLRESEARFRDLVEGSIQGIIVVQDGRAVFANRAAAEILGYGAPPDVLALEGIEALFAPHERAWLSEHYEKHLRWESVPSIFEFQALRADGSVIWIENRERLVAWNEKPAIQLTFVEVTSRKEFEEALRRNEANYRLLVENQTDLVAKIDLDGRFVFVSPSCCRTFGKTEEELVGAEYGHLVHEADRKVTAEAVERLKSVPHTAYVEHRALTTDGWRWIAWMGTAVLNDDGEPTEFIAVGRDVSVRRSFEKALHESEARLLAIMNNAPGAIILKDREGRLVAANKAHLERLGLKWDDLKGKTAYDYNPPAVAKEVVEQERKVMETRQPQTFEVTREHPGLGSRTFMVVRFPVISEDSQLIGVGALSIDVTDFNGAEHSGNADAHCPPV